MKIYSVFWETKNGEFRNLYEDRVGEWWLGGGKGIFLHIFYSKKDAENAVKIIKSNL